MSDPDIVNFILKSNNQFIVMANSYLEELNLPGSRIYLIEVGENIRSNRKFITVPYLGSDYSRITPKHKMIEKYLKWWDYMAYEVIDITPEHWYMTHLSINFWW